MKQIPENLSGMAPSGPQKAATAMPPLPAEEREGEPASAEEQALYERTVAAGLKAIYQKDGLPAIIDALDTQDPREGVGTVTASVMQRVAQAAKQKGVPIPSDVLMHAAGEVFENVAELAQNAGIHDFEKDPEALQGAMVRAFDEMRVGLSNMGLIDKAEMEADFNEIRQADASGAPAPAAAAPAGPPPPQRGAGLMSRGA